MFENNTRWTRCTESEWWMHIINPYRAKHFLQRDLYTARSALLRALLFLRMIFIFYKKIMYVLAKQNSVSARKRTAHRWNEHADDNNCGCNQKITARQLSHAPCSSSLFLLWLIWLLQMSAQSLAVRVTNKSEVIIIAGARRGFLTGFSTGNL